MGCGAQQRPAPPTASRVYVAPAADKLSAERHEHDACHDQHRHIRQYASTQGAPDTATLVQMLRSSGMQACRRLGAELEELRSQAAKRSGSDTGTRSSASSHVEPLSAGPRSLDALLEWDAQLYGPSGTPYEGGLFKLALWFPEEYPFKPPRVQFITPCFHPNISERGQVCLNILKEEWSPMLTVSSLLTCISSLLCEPNPQDPLNSEAADLLEKRPATFLSTAQAWTRRYAMKGGAPHGGSGHRGSSHAHSNTVHGAEDDLSRDPLATYQTVHGRAISESAALRQAMMASRYSG
mmetsp:Transcript_44922/g.82019  ORF Transcript_44922/g.82019 Transcript_44922/m.82019 type:complete len:295 (+) Transcript_44922:55-939(+)